MNFHQFLLAGSLFSSFAFNTLAQTTHNWEINNTTLIGGNTVTVHGQPKIIQTNLGPALEFDGSDDAVVVNANPLTGATEFTVEVIFKPYSGGNFEQRFVHMEQNDANRMLVELRSNISNWYLDTFIKSGASSKTLVSSTLTHPSDLWYHAALVYKNNTMTHYVNGVQELTGTVNYTSVTSGKTSVGMRLTQVHYYKGAIKTLKVTLQALSPSSFITHDAEVLNGVVSSSMIPVNKDNFYVASFPENNQAQLHLTLLENTDLDIRLYNTLGAEVRTYSSSSTAGYIKIDLDNGELSSGLYKVIVKAGEKYFTGSVVFY